MIRLFRFRWSPYACKVQKCLELKRLAFEPIDVGYMDRREIVRLSGQVVVPVLADGDTVIADSPRITAYLDERYPVSLRPAPLAAAAAAFEGWADNTVEDVAFRIASPAVEQRFADRHDAAMYRYIKERKFGAGCIAAWAAGAAELRARLRALLAPLARTLEAQPYLLGETPTLADAAVWGNLAMLEWAQPGWVARELPELTGWYGKL